MSKESKPSVIRAVFEFPPERFGGSVQHVLELSNKINDNLERQIIIAPKCDGHENYDENNSIDIIRIKTPKIFSSTNLMNISYFLFSLLLVRKIRNDSYLSTFDIVHAHGMLVGIYIKLFMNIYNIRIPVVMMIHGRYPKKIRKFSINYYIEDFLIKLCRPDYAIVLDDGTEIQKLEYILNKCDIPYQIVYHGIDTDFYKPNLDHACESNEFRILFPHRHITVKRPDIAVAILGRLLVFENCKNTELIFLATKKSNVLNDDSIGPHVAQCVKFEGKQDKDGMLKFINLSDVVIGTSLESNMGRAIQEAMACEKPVIVFDCGRMSELIKNKENGILIEPADINNFAENLKLLSEDSELRFRIGKNARKTIINERNWNTRILKELNSYDAVLKKN